MEELGDRIRRLRQARGWSQSELASRAGTTQAVISRIERGLHSPTIAMAQRLHGAMGERLVLMSEPLPQVDAAHLADELQLSMGARLERAFHWMRFNGALHGAARARASHDG